MIRAAKVSDAHDLARRVRNEDRREIRAASGASPLKALLHGVRKSEDCVAFCPKGRVEALYGVIETGPGQAFPWMLASDAAFGKHMRGFARIWRPEIARWHERWPRLQGVVFAENTTHIRWLRWCGFQIGEPEMRGGAMFCPFRKHV